MSEHRCRLSGEVLHHVFADLGVSPVSNDFLREDQLDEPESFYPLKAMVGEKSLLVQLSDVRKATAIFNDAYVYFSSYSSSWLSHAEAYAEKMTERFALGAKSRVIEVASNDGYLLQYFQKRGIEVLGIEPSASVAKVAVQEKQIPTRVEFFGAKLGAALAKENLRADLMAANNVLAHVPDLHDFVEGFRLALAPRGVATFEFPHVGELIAHAQFDTIYHEHYSYLSLRTARAAFAAHELEVFDVEKLPTHGGSLRLFVHHAADTTHAVSERVRALAEEEDARGLGTLSTYTRFQEDVDRVKRDLLSFLIDARQRGKTVAGYGAPAKGNTLLNYCGIRRDLVSYTVDRSPHKQGLYTPGSRIAVRPVEELKATRPDYVLILPWNLREEIVAQTDWIRAWGGKWVVAIPRLEVLG